MLDEKLDQIVLALLFASEEPLSARKLSGVLGEDVTAEDIKRSIARLTEVLVESIPSIRLERVGGGFQLATNTEYADYIARLYSGRRKQRLSKPAMQTLAIIAYKQPITRADMENIRGVGCGGVITTLMERSLIRIVGKAKVLGAPFLYGTTQEFLEYLGLNSVKDLPSMEELEAMLAREVAAEQIEDSEGTAEPEGDADEDDEGEERDVAPEAAGSARMDAFNLPGGKRDRNHDETEDDTSQITDEADEDYEWKPEESSEEGTRVKVDDNE